MGHRVDPSVEAFRALASRWLAAPCAWGGLNPAEACTVALYLSPQTLWPGEVLVQEGDAVAVDRLWLVLAGEVSVQSQALQLEAAGMVVRVMGPGSWIGELSLLDGGPRSASCVASTELRLAALGRDELERLMDEHPAVASRLLLTLAQRMAGHLRDLTRKLQLFAQMNRTLNQALDAPADATPTVDWPAIDDAD